MVKLLKLVSGVCIVVAMSGCVAEPRGVEIITDLPSTLATGANTQVDGPAITGSIDLRQRITLPPDAVVTITLSDVSLADAPEVVLSQKTFRTNGLQAPFPFTLPYEQKLINPQQFIIVSAVIRQNERLLFVTDTANEVINNNAGTQKKLLLVPVYYSEDVVQMHEEAATKR